MERLGTAAAWARAAEILVVVSSCGVLLFVIIWATIAGDAAYGWATAALLVALIGFVLMRRDASRAGLGIEASLQLRQREQIESRLDEQGGTLSSREDMRDWVESLLTTSAEWGWEMGRMGFRTPPRPTIRWQDDHARIVGEAEAPEDAR